MEFVVIMLFGRQKVGDISWYQLDGFRDATLIYPPTELEPHLIVSPVSLVA